ncbi:hypothetical protein [Variovorax paradoxus]|uniref:Uncharacterized protein n=1 Tax=Variovorax paradoxus TaxID=34073 RepID=A0A679J3A7_VARPD|nr:hypothetical protein VVAX_01133 [Variovorax paradoxus]
MIETLSSAESADLVRLWRCRQTLSPDDMGAMYRIVGEALGACNPPELQVLGEGRQELVAQFIYVKVLRLNADPADPGEAEERAGHSAPSTAFALCAYFRRYLIDCTRASAFRRKLSIGDQITEAQLEDEVGASEELDGCLAEHGLSVQRVQLAARAFIAGLPEPERLLLCEGFGKEAEGGLSGIASRHAIASYHYRAGRLGLVHKREGLTADYAKTRLGGWLQQTLGIAIEADNMAAILQVFKILGAEASYV